MRKTRNQTRCCIQNDPIDHQIKGFSLCDCEDEVQHSIDDFSRFSQQNLTFKRSLDVKIDLEEEETRHSRIEMSK